MHTKLFFSGNDMKPVSSVSVFTPKAVLLGTKYVLSVFALRYDSELLKKKKKLRFFIKRKLFCFGIIVFDIVHRGVFCLFVCFWLNSEPAHERALHYSCDLLF